LDYVVKDCLWDKNCVVSLSYGCSIWGFVLLLYILASQDIISRMFYLYAMEFDLLTTSIVLSENKLLWRPRILSTRLGA
jgi:hypothetical protein